MLHHAFFAAIGMENKIKPYKVMFSPFNNENIDNEKIDSSDSYFKDCLYNLCRDEHEKRDIMYIVTVCRAISRLLLPYINAKENKKLKNYGGYGYDKATNTLYCDYLNVDACSFNNEEATDYKDHEHIIVSIKNGLIMKAFCINGCCSRYRIQTKSFDNSQEIKNSSAAIYAVLCYILYKQKYGKKTKTGEIICKHFDDIITNYKKADYSTCYKAILALTNDMYELFNFPDEVAWKLGKLPIEPHHFNTFDIKKINITQIPKLSNKVGNSNFLK